MAARRECSTSAVQAGFVLACGVFLVPENALADEGLVLEEVHVTGSRIHNANLVSSSPVTQVDRSEILLSGVTRAEDLLKNLTQAYLGQNSSLSDGNFGAASGTATIDLRGLGDERTLVLLGGRRLPTGSPLTAGAADINQIPAALIDRVEVLTGGASAVYGSDALAGVVNFVLLEDFEGVELNYQFSQYRHDNDNNAMARRLETSGFPIPSGSRRDGDTSDVSLVAGKNLADDRGNITLYGGYRDTDPVSQADRIYGACGLLPSTGPDPSVCGGRQTIEEGLFTDFGLLEVLQGVPSFAFMVAGEEFVPWDGRQYNIAPGLSFQRADERYTAGAFGHVRINPRTEVYTELMYMDDRSDFAIHPSGSFHKINTLSCGNPLLSPQQFQALCADYGLGPADSQFVSIGRLNVEGGPRKRKLDHEAWRAVLGARGNINDSWHYDVYGQRSYVDYREKISNELSVEKMQRALDVVADPATGVPVCVSALDGTDPACVPWDIFREGGVTGEALDYLAFPLAADGHTKQTVVSAYLAGDLQHYGVVSPFADTGVDLVIGVEYREEELKYRPDENYLSGLAGTPGEPVQAVDGDFDVTELYTELRVPLVEGAYLAESVTLELGYRYSDYSTGETTDTYKFAATWSPVEQLSLRGSFQHAVRVPNVDELFSPRYTTQLFDPSGDPCAGTTPARSEEDCARSGVTPDQYGAIPANPTPLYNFLFGGNPDLDPEKSDTRSAGFVYQTDLFDGVSFSLDWYEIEIKDTINAIGGGIVLENCLNTGAATFCDRVQRDPGPGDLWIPTGEGFHDASNGNVSTLTTEGYDLVFDVNVAVGALGFVSFHTLVSYVDKWDLQALPGEKPFDCLGLVFPPCLPTVPELRSSLRTTWTTPWNLAISGQWRYIDDIRIDQLLVENPQDTKIDAQNYFDIAVLWDVNEDIALRLGVNNVLDEEPPTVLFGDGNTLPGMYDALGQYWFLGLGVSF